MGGNRGKREPRESHRNRQGVRVPTAPFREGQSGGLGTGPPYHMRDRFSPVILRAGFRVFRVVSGSTKLESC